MKVAPRILWIEIAALAQVHFQNLQRLPHLLNNVSRERSRHHVRSLAHKQRVLQQVAQPLQRVADRRLRQVQLHPGAGDIALAIDRFEHHKQVQVDLA